MRRRRGEGEGSGGAGRVLSVSELCDVERCARQAQWDRRFGKLRSRTWKSAGARGERIHRAESLRAALAGSARRPGKREGCFVATAVFGEDAPETAALRRFRDRALAASAAGRAGIALYYRVSPPVAQLLSASPQAAGVVRAGLRAAIAGLPARWTGLPAEGEERGIGEAGV